MPTLRSFAAASLATGALALSLPVSAAHADAGSPGSASAVTTEVKLDVSLLNKAVDVPVDVALNKVHSPAQRSDAMLTTKVDGVAQSAPVTLVEAHVGKSVTTADDHGTTASVQLAGAGVHAPGLPAAALLGLDALSARASCPVDGPPTADVTMPAQVTVLGKSVTLGLNGPSHVSVPAIGTVDVEFAKKTTTSTTAAASALEVHVDLNPLNLNVARVTGTITVASVSCEKPVPGPAPVVDAASGAAPATVAARPVTADGQAKLATTGAGPTGPLLAAAGALLLAGVGVLWLNRRRRQH